MADKAYVVTKTSPIAVSKKEHNDDFIDRLNYWTTVKIIAGFTSLLLTYNVVGQAIQCFIPAEYPVG
uniref:Innexin n=1 Tax=Panagrolaimus sp. JU765 TaxID=591449 RepID=A0AC34QWY4_9BILA